jgi:membrane-bound serine protease (ClpP class)
MKGAMKTLFTVFVLLLDEIALVALVLYILWELGIELSPGVIIGVTVLLGICVFVIYKLIASVLKRKPMTGSEGMIGLEGKVVKPLNNDGLIQVCGELWKATSTDATTIAIDEEVIVVGIKGLKLLVRRRNDAEPSKGVSV